MFSERAMEVSWESSELDLSWAMWWCFWLEISRQTPTWGSRRAGGRIMEWKGTQGTRWGFPREFSVDPKLGEVEGCVVGNMNGPQLGYVLRASVGSSEMDPNLTILTGQCSEIRG